MEDKAKKRAQRDMKKLKKKWKREEKIEKFFHKFKKPMQYERIPVPDFDTRTIMLSSFRNSYADFLHMRYNQENSELQNHSTQLFWHRTYLQKKRMNSLSVTMDMETERVKRSELPEESIQEEESVFDGRYMVSEVNESLYARRTFILNEKDIGTYYDYESANYSILSAKQIGTDEIVCPSCGNPTTRENLIDGCDYCGTKFTVEDLEDKVNDFRIMVEISNDGLSEQARKLDLESDRAAGAMVRRFDPNFSLRSFRANIFNKVAAIHFADSMQQISAFSDDDLSYLMDQYKNIAYIDFRYLIFKDDSFMINHGLKDKNNYYVEDGMQKITCGVALGLFELIDGKIQLRMEQVNLELEKSAECKTQNICGPSIFKCNSCGSSLSLMNGKGCQYCGRELDLRQYDWVITKYTSKLAEYGKSWRTFD